MTQLSAFLTNLFLSAFRHIGSIILSLILIIVGCFTSTTCRNIGLFLLALNVIVAIVSAIRMQRMMNYRDEDDPAFNEMMDAIWSDPKLFVADMIDAQNKNKELHGEDLLSLSDDEIFDAIYYQNLDITENAEDTEDELALFSGARRIVYILNLYDAEVQNGGLCQFFVNSSRAVAPYVAEALEVVGAKEHLAHFTEFVDTNQINTSDLSSFMVRSTRGFIKQTKRFDFDAFDEKYYGLPALQEAVISYIKANINEF